jgi:hypothetical protein
MAVKIVGDSNFRDLFASHREEMESDTGMKLEFIYATSVASVKTALEGLDGLEACLDAVLIATPTNEISLKSRNNTKSREGIVESVVTELYNQVVNFATKNEATLLVICQPFLRLEPPWIEAKMKHYLDFLKTTHNSIGNKNVHLGSAVDVETGDLKPDKIHLNKEGLSKLKDIMIADLKTTKTEIAILRNGGIEEVEEDEDMEQTPTNDTRTLRNTPARKKRPLDKSPEEDGKVKKKKSKDRIDAVLDKLDLMMGRMNEERISNRNRFDKLDERLDTHVQEQETLKKEIDSIKKSDNTFAASLREDLDAVENSNSRDTVIVKRLTTTEIIPKDKKELTTLILNEGKAILTLILGDATGMKFISPLYVNNMKRNNKDGETIDNKELPPFKIVFKHLHDAVTFKEKCIAASKDPGHRLHKVYVANQQTIGTRVRLSILWVIADHLKKEKKDSWVSQSLPKPTLMVKEVGNLVRTYSYTEAAMTYGDKIEQKVKDEATKLAKRFFYGQVEKIFLILKD